MGRKRAREKTTNLEFSHNVPRGEHNVERNIGRIKGSGVTKFTVLSDDFFGHYTHYFDGRSQACLPVNCRGCARQIDRRWYCYFWAKMLRTGEIVMFELPPSGAIFLESIRKDYKSTRGVQLYGWRSNGRNNKKVVIEFRGIDAAAAVPEGFPRVEKFLANLWRVEVQEECSTTNDPLGRMSPRERIEAERSAPKVYNRVLDLERNGNHA